MIRAHRTVIISLTAGILLLSVSLLSLGHSATAQRVTANPSPSASSTPDPYAGLTIDELAARRYGGGQLSVAETMTVTAAFTRTLMVYPSDGLTIFGFMNTPKGPGPFPVIIAVHGYIDPARYYTLDYTTRYADALARAGYVVLHPNLRDYPPSDRETGPGLFRVGFAVDVLNLVALVRQQAGEPGPLAAANPKQIGIWGHSMGGGVSLHVLTLSQDVKAAVLYGAMSGDEHKNYERSGLWSNGQRGQKERAAPDTITKLVSPIDYLGRIQAAVSIHHGAADATVPPEWSTDLCSRLQALHKPVECFTYPGEPHTFTGPGDRLFIDRTIKFFDEWLKGP
jgi:dipeptidyl aminopeptidase/acylaminoacyl peptidase